MKLLSTDPLNVDPTMASTIAFNLQNLKVLTSQGFVTFDGIAQMGIKRVYEIAFTDHSSITASANHFFYTLDGREIPVSELESGVELIGTEQKIVHSITYVGEQQTYDVYNTETHTYFANGLLSHNCEFISSDPLLIDTVVLTNLTSETEQIKPFGTSADITFYKEPKAGNTYLIGMDVATGSGNDYTAIVVYDFPNLEQIAEYRTNSMSSVSSYHTLKKLLKIFDKIKATTYFSVENNGVGEAIIALYESDENPPESATFVSEEGQKRSGMTTTGKSKIKACIALKEMIERNSIKVRSKTTVAELKQFVRTRGSYAAKSGGTDDLVMATIIAIRLLSEIANFDQVAYDKLYSSSYVSDSTSEYDDGDFGIGFVIG